MSRQLTISMFYVGFGDCFLVQIPTPDGRTFRVLFDCGRHTGGAEENLKLSQAVWAEAKDPGSQTVSIDLVVATHRHKDHVSGFASPGWEKVAVREVWMPWTEDPKDDQARGLVARQTQAAAEALNALVTRGMAAADSDVGPAGLMQLGLSNQAAMDQLYGGFAGNPRRRFLPLADDPHTPLTLDGFPTIKFHVMGPPRDEAAMSAMNPPAKETFRHLAVADAGAAGTKNAPLFAAEWQVPLEKIAQALLDKGDRKAIIGFSEVNDDLEGLTALVDNAINNTSLVIMIEVGSANLLFCADAQWGNWKSILAQPHWTEVLKKASFLKAGHHASHNASPVTLINDLLPDGIPTMVSTVEGAYSSVPSEDVLGGYTSNKFRIARSDKPQEADGTVYAVRTDDRTVLNLPF